MQGCSKHADVAFSSGQYATRRSSHLIKKLNRRELGLAEVDNHHILLSKCRSFKPTEKFVFPGKILKTGDVVVSRSESIILNVNTMEEFKATDLFPSEKIRDALVVLPTFTAVNFPTSPHCIFLVTNFGRLFVYDLRTRLMVFKYQMDPNLKYGRLRWNIENSELYVMAHEHPQSISGPGTLSGTASRSPPRLTISVFTLTPIRFKAMCVLDSRVEAAVLLDNILLSFKTRPESLVVQNFDMLYKERCDFVDQENELANSNTVVPMNLQFSMGSEVMLEIFGHYDNIHFGNSKYLMLTRSNNTSAVTELHSWQLSSQKVLSTTPNRIVLSESPPNLLLCNVPTLFANPDGSDTVLFFEGRSIVCSYVERNASAYVETDFVLRRLWEVDLTKFNEADFSSLADNEIVVTAVNYNGDETLLVAVAYSSSYKERIFASYSRRRWVLYCYLIDRLTGTVHDRVKLNIPCPDVENIDGHNFGHNVELDKDMLTSTVSLAGRAHVNVFRIVDDYQRNWQNEIKRDFVAFPSAMNKQQRRKARQAAARAAQ